MIFCFILSCNNNKDKAIELNNKIITDQTELFRLKDNLYNHFYIYANEEKMRVAFDSLNNGLNSMITYYEQLHINNNESTIIKSMLEFLLAYQNLANNEYSLIMSKKTIPHILITEKDLNSLDSIFAVVNKKQEEISTKFSEAQMNFAKQNNFILEE